MYAIYIHVTRRLRIRALSPQSAVQHLHSSISDLAQLLSAMDIVSAASNYINKMVATDDATGKMKVLLLDSETVGTRTT